MGLLRQIEGGTQRGLSGLEDRAREANIASKARRIGGDESVGSAADYVVMGTPSMIEARHKVKPDQVEGLRKAQSEQVRADLMQSSPLGGGTSSRQALAPHFARQMNRGPLGGQYGLVEGAAQFANRQGVRRGGLAAAGVGATVGSGILLTEGAQQLMTLMDFLRHGQEVEQRAEESPLA